MSRLSLIAVSVALVSIALLVWSHSQPTPAPPADVAPQGSTQTLVDSQLDSLPRQAATLSDANLNLYVTTSQAQSTWGLSGTKELPAGTGMLFYIPGREQLSFWMKDMYIPIDMLWLDSKREVIHIKSNVLPDTYPQSFSNPVDTRADYVLELNSGDAKKYNIKIGDELIYTGDVTDFLQQTTD